MGRNNSDFQSSISRPFSSKCSSQCLCNESPTHAHLFLYKNRPIYPHDGAHHPDENGNNSVKGPSSTAKRSRFSNGTSFNVCIAVASNTTLVVNSTSFLAGTSGQWHLPTPLVH